MAKFIKVPRYDKQEVFVNIETVTFIAPYNKNISEIYFNDGEAEPLRVLMPIENLQKVM